MNYFEMRSVTSPTAPQRTLTRRAAYARDGALTAVYFGAVIVVATAVVVSLCNGIYAPSNRIWLPLADIGRQVAEDASWLLPTFLGAEVGLVAILLGQSLGSTPPADIGRSRDIIASLCYIITGFALAQLALTSCGAVVHHDLAPHVWSSAVLVLLIGSFALWIGGLVFGPKVKQLEVARSARDRAELARDSLSVPDRPVRRSVVRLTVVVIVTALIAAAVGILFVLPDLRYEADRTTTWFIGHVVTLAVLSAWGSTQAVFISILRSGNTIPKLNLATALLLTAANLYVFSPLGPNASFASFQSSDAASLSTQVIPLASVWLLPHTKAVSVSAGFTVSVVARAFFERRRRLLAEDAVALEAGSSTV